jgi:hypothetical protein
MVMNAIGHALSPATQVLNKSIAIKDWLKKNIRQQ